ncbi:MAG: CADD family putative folate metabolism protein [Alphaproteobacteria bacterium]
MTDIFAATLDPLHLLKHPFYQAWMAGTLSREELCDYARQYYAHVDAFPRYLGALHAQCPDAAMRREILDNLNDEEGVTHGTSHPELWLQFAEGIGAPRAEVTATEPRGAIRNVIDTFMGAAQHSLPEGLGALYAYESQVPEIAESKISGLTQNYGVTDARTLKFFEVHKTADITHRHVIKAMLDRLPEVQKQEAAAAAQKAAKALWDFLSDVHAKPHDNCAAA